MICARSSTLAVLAAMFGICAAAAASGAQACYVATSASGSSTAQSDALRGIPGAPPRCESTDPPSPTKLDTALILARRFAQPESTDSHLSAVSRLLVGAENIGKAEVSIRFTSQPAPDVVRRIERDTGADFVRVDGKIAHVGAVYGATVPLGRLDAIAARSDVARVESAWHLAEPAPLEVTGPMVGADQIWSLTDRSGRLATGTGVVVANFDTGVDVFHPAFFSADGPEWDWIDSNGSGALEPRADCVDLDRNRECSAGELLKLLDARWRHESTAGRVTEIFVDGRYDVGVDWLFTDTDGNGARGFGPPGFGENDPAFGEPLYVGDDRNGNGRIDVGEPVVSLGTNRILSALDSTGEEHRRGRDLHTTFGDGSGHGTAVAAIVVGGDVGLSRFAGLAPDADLLSADRYENPYTRYIPWARERGARVMNYEFGGYVGVFLDGSMNLDAVIDTLAAQGIVQVAAAGNLGRGERHFRVVLPGEVGGSETRVRFRVPPASELPSGNDAVAVVMSLHWRNPSADLAVGVTTVTGGPGNTITLKADELGDNGLLVETADGHSIWARREISSRGTVRMDIHIYSAMGPGIEVGDWGLTLHNPGPALLVDGYLADYAEPWAFGVGFLDYVDATTTTTHPATADSIISVANFHPRGVDAGSKAGEKGHLEVRSGKGPRLDGISTVDVAAPGTYTIAPRSRHSGSPDVRAGPGAYGWFSGTSAAAPHVVGVVALLLQLDPALDHWQVKDAIRRGARSDEITGLVPNQSWGCGRLDAVGSAAAAGIGKGDGARRSGRVATGPAAELPHTIYVPLARLEARGGCW